MKVKHSASQSLKALIATTILIIMILNTTLLLPVSPVLAEEQTCGECKGSCCESSGDQCCSQGAMGCCQTTENTECTLPTTAVETEDLIIALGKKAIMSNDKTWEAYTIVMSSEIAHDTFESYRSDQYSVETEYSLVIVNTTMNAALVFVPVVLKTDPNVTETIVFGVIEGEFVGIAELIHGSHIQCYWVLWWKVCIDWCATLCSAGQIICGVGCTGGCIALATLFAPPVVPVCGTLCLGLCTYGLGGCYEACVYAMA